MEDCFVKRKNLGLYVCNRLPQLVKGFIWTPDNFVIPKGQEQTLATWQDAIFSPSDRIFYWPPFVKIEMLSTEAVYEDTPLSFIPVLDGQYRFRGHIRQNMCTHKNMFSHRGASGRIFLVDVLNQILGTRAENGDFMGIKLALLHTEKFAWSDGSTGTTSPVYVALEDAHEIDQYGDIVEGKFLKSLIRIVDVELTKISASATEIVVDVKVDCDGTPVVGLVAADFILYEPDGSTVHAITSVTESATVPGRYTIEAAGIVTGSFVALQTADELTLNGYELPEPFLVTFP